MRHTLMYFFIFAPMLLTRILLIGLLSVVLFSCDTYQKISKSGDLDLKTAKAKEYYEKGEYLKAIPLLEELIQIYRGSKPVDDMMFMYAKSHFEQGEFLIASFYFKSLYDSYPTSKYAEESLYLNAVSFQRMSPETNLDQDNTTKAIENYQLFVNAYPSSEKLTDCNTAIKILRRKLEKKAFDGAKLYYNTGQYKAAATAFSNLAKTYPDSEDLEEAEFLIVKSYYLYAQQSISSKQIERYEQAINAYKNFAADFKNSRYLPDAEEIKEACLKNIEKLKNEYYESEKK